MTDSKKKLSYYERNKDKIAKKYQEKKNQISEYNKEYYKDTKIVKSQYNKEYYEKIKKDKRQTLEYYEYQKKYYQLKKQGLRPCDIKRRQDHEAKQNNLKCVVTFF